MAAKPQVFALAFGSAGSVSSAIQIAYLDARGFGVAIPSAWTAASVGFEVSMDGTTYMRLRDNSGTSVMVTGIGTASASVYAAPAECWVANAYPWLRLASLDSAGTAYVNQGNARTVSLITAV